MASTSSAQLISSSQTSLESEEDYRRWDEDDELYQVDDAQLSPFPTPSTCDLDSRVERDKFARAPHNSESETDSRLPTIGLPTPEPVTDEVDARTNTGPEETKPGWLFGQLLSGLSLDSSRGEDFWVAGTGFPIDTNFTVASREAWTNGKGKARAESAVRRYNLRPRQHRVDSVIASASEDSPVRNEAIRLANDPSQSTSRSNSISRSTVSGGTSCASIPLRERLVRILPMDTRERLREEPERCVAPTRKSGRPRCIRKTKGSLEVFNRVPSTLTCSTIESVDVDSLAFVRDLIGSALCGSPHKKGSSLEFDKICEGLDDLSEDDRAIFHEWIRALASEPQSTKEGLPMSSPETASSAQGISTAAPRQEAPAGSSASNRPVTRSMTRGSPPKSEAAAISATLTARDPSLPYFQKIDLYQPKSTAIRSTSAVLRDVLMRPLTETDLEPGFIYMYWFPGNFGYLKIGYTRGSAAERLEQWRRRCKHAVESVDTELFAVEVAVEHVSRVEALVHAELKDVRCREVNCLGCGGNHVEWFRETIHHARKVYDKFADWMRTKPYAYVAGEPGTGWKLRQDIKQELIEKLCQPLERSPATPKGKPVASSRRSLK